MRRSSLWCSVTAHVAQAGGEVVAEFREVESGKRADRPQIAATLASCRTRRAVLVIEKLDQLARNARFLAGTNETPAGGNQGAAQGG
jgi:DNA invertase Pin-like site-specific DNA recombinase